MAQVHDPGSSRVIAGHRGSSACWRRCMTPGAGSESRGAESESADSDSAVITAPPQAAQAKMPCTHQTSAPHFELAMSSPSDKQSVPRPALPDDAPPMLRALFDTAVDDLLSAASEEEALMCASIVATMLEAVAASSANPLAVLATVFGRESAEVCATACTDAARELDAEAASAGGHVSEPAAARVAHNIVRRIMRGGRTRLFAPRVLRARGVHVRRAPRARRGHRRAVRLSAVASAGDGPPPSSDREPPPAREWSRRSRASSHATVAATAIDRATPDVRHTHRGRAAGDGRREPHATRRPPCEGALRRRRLARLHARGPMRPCWRVGAITRRRAPFTELARGGPCACRWPSRARLGGAGGG